MSDEHQIQDFSKPNFSSQPVAGNATIPPKLQQLLNQISDVDKVKLLQIANHYKLDLDDPAYLPLLLTREGIEALENAAEKLNHDAYKVVDYAIQKAESAVSQTAGAKIDEIEEAKNRAETAFKNAVSAWSYEVFESAVSSALKTSLPGAATAASEVSIILIERLENATNNCIKKNQLGCRRNRAAEFQSNAAGAFNYAAARRVARRWRIIPGHSKGSGIYSQKNC